MHKVVFVISGSKKLWNWKSLLTLFQRGERGETLTLFQLGEGEETLTLYQLGEGGDVNPIPAEGKGETVTADKIVMKVVFTFSGTQKTVELENHF